MQNREAKLISVIIPALHRPDLTQMCIDSLVRQTLPTERFEVVVVENDAQPSTTLPPPWPENVRVIELAENYGTTGSINRGYADSTSKYVLILNNDVELDSQFLERLQEAIEQSDRNGFATGKLLNARDPSRLDGAGDALLLGGGTYRLGHQDKDVGQYESPFRVIAGCGAATLFRRSVLDEVGALDEDLFAYLDDIDLGLRVHLFGYQGVYVPGAVAYHVGSATLGGSSFHPKIVEWVTRNQVLLLVKDYPAGVLALLLPRIIVFQLLWFCVALARGRVVPYVKGILGVFRLFARMLRKRRWLMQRQRMSNGDLLAALVSSEKQVYHWHKRQPPAQRSSLLKVYFWLFDRSYR
jgi:GT2 family glycosyltransferase